MAAVNYTLDNHQHGFSKQLVFHHKSKNPANYSSGRLVSMLADFFRVDDIRYQIEEHHRLHKGFVIDFGMRSAGSVYDQLLHYVSFGLEVQGWQVEIHKSPVYAEWGRSKFTLFYCLIFL